MAYKNNWLRHLFAFATGEGYSDELARDFCHEDLWEPSKPVRWRWLKLVWVYSVSVLAQVTLTGLVVGVLVSLFKPAPPHVWLFFIGGATMLGLIFAILFATTACIDQRRQKN